MVRSFTDALLREAYGYLLSRALVVRQERVDLAEEGVDYNVIKYNPLGSADFVNPNFDVAYLEAWIAVDPDTPALFEVPAIDDRYYTAQFLDEWGEVIVNINERTFPDHPSGTFALVAPGAGDSAPEGATPIELHSNKAKLLARVELRDTPRNAVELARRFTLCSTGTPAIAPPPAVPDFDNRHLIGVEIFEHASDLISSAADVSPVAATQQSIALEIAEHVATGPDARAAIDDRIRNEVVPWFLNYAITESGSFRDGWLGTQIVGDYGDQFLIRSAANFVGIWANSATECVYFVSTRDGSGEPLNGSRTYRMHFEPGELPNTVVDAYWSIILVSLPDYRVIPNPQNRFNLNSYSPLALGDDGSLNLYFAPCSPDGTSRENWLPAPENSPFSLTFRTYVPRHRVRNADWFPPPLTAID